MKLKEFLEKFCDGVMNIKIMRITSKGNSGLPFVTLRDCQRHDIIETEMFFVIEDMEVIRVNVEEEYLVISIVDNMF